MRTKTREAAFGKWGSILGHLGFGELLDGKHQTCPLCSAKHKFRYTDYKSNGEWICVCGQGDGFDLIMKMQCINFETAAKMVDHVIGNEDLKVEETFKPEIDVEQRRRRLNALWAGATAPELLVEYLRSRGIDDHHSQFKGLTDLRGHNEMPDYSDNTIKWGMCALIRNGKGEPVSIHRTYFGDPRVKKIMPPTEKIVGAGIRLGWAPGARSLVVGEGIETTLKGMEVLRTPGLAAISAHGMENIIIPKEFDSIVILADNDRSFTGQKAAFTLARKLDTGKRKVMVYMPATRGEDILDSGLQVRSIQQWSNYETGQ